MNLSLCSKCGKIVTAKHLSENNKEYLEKDCTECGMTKELISNDSTQYRQKRSMMAGTEYPGCDLNCIECSHKLPNIVFIETTNRCNMNCPICITNVPSMGFEFEPKMEYFDKIFSYYSKFEFPPSMQLFGGEPTMRDDIFDIIDLAKSYGLSVRLVTNGLKLANKEYCDKMMTSGASVLISFDGLNRKMYEKLRAFPGSLDLKMKALENISRHKRGKVVLMTVIDKNLNGDDMPKFLEHCIKNEEIIRGMFLMPLSEVWTEERLDYEPDRTTQEDVEKLVNNAVEGTVEFIPLGSMNYINLARIFKLKNMPFLGVHPNCESFTLLISNGKHHVAISKYLKQGLIAFTKDVKTLDNSVKRYSRNTGSFRKFLISLSVARLFIKHINFGAFVDARGVKAWSRWASIIGSVLGGSKFKDIIKERTNVKRILQIILLPFEDDKTLESERLEKCTSCFAYIDPETDEIESIPFCIWEKFKNVIMRENAKKYNKEGYVKGLSGEPSEIGQVKK